MSIEKSSPTTEETHELEIKQFRDELSEQGISEDDKTLLRWLRAHKFNIRKAKHMYVKSMHLKKSMHVDGILEAYIAPTVIWKYFAAGICGYDKEGSPVYVELFGKLDMRGLMRSTRTGDLERWKFWQCEYQAKLLRQQTEKLHKDVESVMIIIDIGDVKAKHMWKPGLKMYLDLAQLYNDNYPWMIKRIFIINTPEIFPLLWKLGSSIMQSSLRKLITILSDNYQEDLLQVIDADQLPECYGGTLKDPTTGDPRCPHVICQGGDVPECYYLTKTLESEDMLSVWIKPGRFLSIECKIRVKGSLLKWEFYTEEDDIGFGLVQKGTKSKKKKELHIPIRRVQCQHRIEGGTHICRKKGEYTIVFDNSYSVSKWKHLHYSVQLLASDFINEVDLKLHQLNPAMHPLTSDVSVQLSSAIQTTRLPVTADSPVTTPSDSERDNEDKL